MGQSHTSEYPLFHLFLFFTWDVSLRLWKDKGLFERETAYYKALAERGVKITFLTWGDHRDLEINLGSHGMIEVIPAYKYIPNPHNKALRALLSPLVLWYARRQISSADLVKTNQMWGSWCAVLAKYFFRKKLLLRTGFELYKFTRDQGACALRRNFIFHLSKLSYSFADLIYVSSKTDKDFIKNHFSINPEKVSVRPNWIDIKRFKPIEMEHEENSVLYVGRLSQQKNIPLLIEALSQTKIDLTIVGIGETKKEIVSLAKEYNVNVIFLGAVPNDQLPALLCRYAVFVLPSYYEGNPKTLLEAMSCGRAVIGTDVDGIKNVIDHEKTGLLSECDKDSLLAHIKRLLGDPSLRTEIGTNARNEIVKTQSLYHILEKEIEDYDKFGLERHDHLES